MLIQLVKAHAIAFIQFVEGQDGKKHREGPWNEEEETKINEQWKVDHFSPLLKETCS